MCQESDVPNPRVVFDRVSSMVVPNAQAAGGIDSWAGMLSSMFSLIRSSGQVTNAYKLGSIHHGFMMRDGKMDKRGL